MKEAYHFSFSSHEEVLFRCPEDVGYFVSQLAIRVEGARQKGVCCFRNLWPPAAV